MTSTRSIPAFLALAIVLAGTSCKSSSAPAIVASPTNDYRTGEVVWRELVTPDPKAAASFYSALLGWSITPVEGSERGYMLIKQNGQPIGGIMQIGRAHV